MSTNKNFVPFTVQIDFNWNAIFNAGIQFSSLEKWSIKQVNFLREKYDGFFFTIISPDLCFDNERKYFFSSKIQKIVVKELKIDKLNYNKSGASILYYPEMCLSLNKDFIEIAFSIFDKEKNIKDYGKCEYFELELPLTAISEYYGNPFTRDEKEVKEFNKSFVEQGWSKKIINDELSDREEIEFTHKFFHVVCKRI